MTISQLVNIIKESIEELPAYHGSGADFDRFNHKKFLGSGCGSQCFGWGTYVTDDKAIGNGYFNNFKNNVIFNGDILLNNGMKFNSDNIQWLMDRKLDEPYKKQIFGKNSNLYYCSDNEADFLYNLFNENHTDEGIDIDKVNRKIEQYINNILTGFGPFDDSKEFDRGFLNSLNEKFNKIRYLVKELNDECYVKNTTPTLYEVDIPDDNGNNYLDWEGEVNLEICDKVFRGFKQIKPKYLDMIANNNEDFKNGIKYYIDKNGDKLDQLHNPPLNVFLRVIFGTDETDKRSYQKKCFTGKDIYKKLVSLLGSDKAASLYLLNCCGIIGIKYESGTMMSKPDGAKEDGHNYVLFNSNDVKITKKEKV